MNRRAFLRFLVAAPIVGPAVVQAIGTTPVVAAAPAAPIAPLWVAKEFWEKEFDYGNRIGYAISIVNRVTGEVRYHGVRLVNRVRLEPHAAVKGRTLAKTLLKSYVQDLNDGCALPAPRWLGDQVIDSGHFWSETALV